jgi:hypothetical protein
VEGTFSETGVSVYICCASIRHNPLYVIIHVNTPKIKLKAAVTERIVNCCHGYIKKLKNKAKYIFHKMHNMASFANPIDKSVYKGKS